MESYNISQLTPDDIGLINKLSFELYLFEGYKAASEEEADKRNREVLKRFLETKNRNE